MEARPNGEKDISRILINAVHLCFFQTSQPRGVARLREIQASTEARGGSVKPVKERAEGRQREDR